MLMLIACKADMNLLVEALLHQLVYQKFWHYDGV